MPISIAGRTKAVMKIFQMASINENTSPNIELLEPVNVNIAEIMNSKKP